MPMSIFSKRYRSLARQLMLARKRLGVTQAELARRLERPQSYVSKSESGERRLDFVELVELAKALGLNPLDLIQKVLADPSFHPDQP
jgi:transcriptional regulator with XRE-family HTH domain